MKRLSRPLALALPLLMLVHGAACQRSGTPPANTSGTGPPASAPPAAAGPTTSPQPVGGVSPTTPQPGDAPVKPVPAVLPNVLAKVNGEEVQRWELETALKQAESSAGGPVPADRRDAILRGIIDELVTYHMLAQEARGRKMTVAEADVDKEMAGIRQGFPTEEAFQQALLLQGVTADQLRQVTRLGMESRKLIDAEVTTKVTVQDADVDTFYNQNLDRFKQGDTVRVSHIYFAVAPDAPPAQRNQARAAAQEILRQLKGGGDFAKLASEQSNDPSGVNGGELGFVEKGQLPPDFEKIAFDLKPGTMSDVVELSTGLHIIKVHEKRGPRTAPLPEVREKLKQFLLDNQRQTLLDQFIGQLKGRTKIEILV